MRNTRVDLQLRMTNRSLKKDEEGEGEEEQDANIEQG